LIEKPERPGYRLKVDDDFDYSSSNNNNNNNNNNLFEIVLTRW
jgi:hypothetical protein